MNGFFQPKYPTVDLAKVPGFRYRGGKATLRKYIARWCPMEGHIYGEPFAGRGNMMFLMHKLAKFSFWALNDKQTIPFFESIRRYDGSPIVWPTEDEFRARIDAGKSDLLYMEPALFWSGGTAKTTSGSMTTFTGNLYYTERTYRRTLLRVQECLKSVSLFDADAIEFIKWNSHEPNNFLYVDPPYINAKVGSYDEHMLDRKKFIRALKDCKARWLLSEYYCPDLVEAFGEPCEKM